MKSDSNLELWKELVSYNKDTGLFYWKERKEHHRPYNTKRKLNWNNEYSGKIAGSNKNGYIYLGYADNEIICSAHRLAWAFVYGEWPKCEIDHINKDKKDNRIKNLRDVSQSINYKNVVKPNKLKERNIYFFKNAYVVRIRDGNGKRKHIGRFKELDDAIVARNEAEREHGYI